jgi:hypothetical protein
MGIQVFFSIPVMPARIARDDCRREDAGVGQTPQQDLTDPQVVSGLGRLQNIRHFTHGELSRATVVG